MSSTPAALPPGGAFPPPPEVESASADLFDYQQIREYIGFVFGSVRRHRLLCALVALGTLGATVAALILLPKRYHVETKLLAQRNQVMASLGNPHRVMPYEADAPTRAAYETVLRRDNLISLVQQTKLLEQWRAERLPLLRLKDKLIWFFTGEPTEDEMLDAMVHTLEKRLYVITGDGTVTIGIHWPNARMAHQLVEAAQQNFLEARHVSEVSAISEAISILEVHATESQNEIEDAVTELHKVIERKRKNPNATVTAQPRPAPRPRTASALEVPQQELAQLKFLIRSKRRAITDLEEFRNRRLTELQGQLAEQRVVYSPNHPVIVDLEERIAAMKKDSPQILELKKDEEELLAQYKSLGGKDPNSMVEPGSAPRQLTPTENALESIIPGMPAIVDDPATTVALDRLRIAQAKYHDLLMRIDAARIELDTARAAFKYRYSVINPPLLPKKPISPKVPIVLAAGVVAALGFAVFTAVAWDLWRRRLYETWQVERALKLPVLAEVKTS